MHELWLLSFSILVGFTVSGIIANLYRVCSSKSDTTAARATRAAVLVIAGPSVLFETAMRGRIAKSWHPLMFWLTLAVIFYWSFAIGVMVLDIAISTGLIG